MRRRRVESEGLREVTLTNFIGVEIDQLASLSTSAKQGSRVRRENGDTCIKVVVSVCGVYSHVPSQGERGSLFQSRVQCNECKW